MYSDLRMHRRSAEVFKHGFTIQMPNIHHSNTFNTAITIASFALIAALIQQPSNASPTTPTSGTVVQFIVYAEEQADVTRVFPGAYVDFTWNNVFVVSIWTNDASRLIPDIQQMMISEEERMV